MPVSQTYRPEKLHLKLGEAFYDEVEGAEFPQAIIRFRNQEAAASVGLDELTDAEWTDHFGRFEPLPGNLPKPLALRYHGHQFQTYNPQLGDGRGFLFAQMREAETGRLLDLGTKGSGQTPWSRGADGRLTLKGGVREVLATEMLQSLGVNTSKSFSLVETGEQLARHDEPSPTRSAVLFRLSHSHIRIGTFQRHAYYDDHDAIKKLLDHTIEHYFPQLRDAGDDQRANAFLREVRDNVALLGAQWMVAGFVHGVLNTDNINVTGESFDYGPWRFAPSFDPNFTAAYFDQTGLYAFGRQPSALLWNLSRLAECLIMFSTKKELEETLEGFAPQLQRQFALGVLRRLGLEPLDHQNDALLARGMLDFLEKTGAPFEQAFFDWYGGARSAQRAARSPSAAHYSGEAFAPAREQILARNPRDAVDLDHAYFQRSEPCTMLIDEVEAIWAPIASDDDWSAFETKLADVRLMGAAYGAGR